MSPFEERIRALEETLSPFAARSFATRGRELAEEECEVRTPFQRTATGSCIRSRSGA